jgi:WD40 repeat protein
LPTLTDLPAQEALRLEQVCQRFEALCKKGPQEQPALETFLADEPELARPVLLCELLQLEVAYRVLRGDVPEAADYLARFPGHEAMVRAVLAAAQPAGGLAPPGYEVLRELGRGGMGVVYMARQQQLQRVVALKVIKAGAHAAAAERARFQTEARVAARLRHPHLVPIHEVGEHQGQPYLVLELVEGGSLADKLSGKPWPARTAAELVRALAGAMQYAHQAGVVHRDLKPGNVLLATDGTPKISDFGLAKVLAGAEAGHTGSGEVLGSPPYMAPEQALGKSKEVGPAADVYALGAILYELLTGRPPFVGETAVDTLVQVVNDEPVPVRRLQPKVPRDLETICHKCLHKDTGKRYASAQALAEDLRRFLAGEPILARPVGAAERAWRWGRRNPGWAAALLLLLVVAAGALGASWSLYAANRQLARAERDAQEKLLESLLAQARGNQTSGRAGQRFESLDALGQAAVVARKLGKGEETMLALRNQAIACMVLPDVRVIKEWQGNPPGTNGLGFDSRFERYAWSSAKEGIVIRQVEDDKELFRLDLLAGAPPDPWINLSFSPSGRFLLVDYFNRAPRPMQLWELKPDGRHLRLSVEKVSGSAAFSPDERTLAVGLPDGAIALYDLVGGGEPKRLPKGTPAEVLAFSPDERLLAAGSVAQPVVQVRELPSGEIVRTLKHEAGVQALAWCPEGSEEGSLPLLASGCMDHRIYLWGSKGQAPRFLEGHGWEVPQLTFDATGTRLLSFGWDMTLRLWDVPARRLSLTLPDVRVLGFSSAGGWQVALLQGQQVRILDVVPSGAHQVLHGHRGGIFEIDFHSRYGWLVSSARESTVRLWDSTSGRQMAQLPDQGAQVLWEPSGEALLTTSKKGLLRWPVHVRSAGRNAPGGPAREKAGRSVPVRHARLGPPVQLRGPEDSPNWCFIVWFGRGHRAVVGRQWPSDKVYLYGLDDRTTKVLTQTDTKGTRFSMSPDARWLAIGAGEEGRGFRVLDVHSGQDVMARDWGNAEVEFSRDGSWLVSTTGRLAPQGAGCYSWRVGTWEMGSHVSLDRSTSSAGVLAVAPDSRMVAVTSTMTAIRLMRPDTFEEIATLIAPDTPLISRLAFSADSSRLGVGAGRTIHVWDLRAVRQALRELGLDWSGPDYPPRVKSPPWRVEVKE